MALLPRLSFFVTILLIFSTSCCADLLRSSSESGSSSSSSTESESTANASSTVTTLPIVTWKWHHVETPYLVALWVFVCWLCKLVIQMNTWLKSFFPESGLLIICGFILGGIVWGADKVQTFSLSPRNFFYFLLPQIILDTGYFMPNKLFFSNLGAILVHAVIGTVWNAAAVGVSLWACYLGGAMGELDIGLLQFLLFGSLLAAVDPVAVIAVFEEVHVNEVLFIWVFGESLLNDGVTVVLYNVFDAFVSLGGAKINAGEIIKGIVSFFVVAFGGSLVGVAFAIIISLLTKFTGKVQIIEAGFIFVLGYLSYLTAEMLSLSSILSITFFGVCCQKYVNANMDEKSVTTVRYAMKVFAIGSETMIFVFLGVTAIDNVIWVWNTGFILLTLLFALVYRFIGVFALTWILNQSRLVPIETIDQIVMSYGGLRGAVAYGLSASLDETRIKEKNLIISTTLIVVYFTVILQGLTMKPLVKWLKVKRVAPSDLKLIEKVNNRACEHILAAMEDISGRIGDNWWTRGWKRFEETYITWFLMKAEARKNNDYLFSIFHKLNLEDAVNYVTEGEKRGSLAFLHNNEGTNVNFEKKFGLEFSGVMPDITSELDYGTDNVPVTSIIRDNIPSVSLNIHEQDTKAINEDINAHHLLQQHLYRSRKNHRHRYSRSDFTINQNEDEVQEIFQRTMRSRLESFKSAKMGVTPAKKITKHPKKEPNQKMSNWKGQENAAYPYGDEDFEFSEVDSTSSGDGRAAGGTSPSRYTTGGIENPAFMPEMDAPPPPWLTEAENDTSVAPSQRAQRRLPWSPNNLRRLAPLRISNRSTDSFLMADAPSTEESFEEPFEEPPKKDGTHL
ncbi:sodium/hydrogen exchanger 3 isoform X1 [Pangasianodon hypophthalmus]|uniref:sodium/hydrogen exchanger 3 isoform X1 n=1 Tax=Pangasianodon hypophthalmus TaxID=310915 RepID=UPI00147A6DC4|nr:sodium/hydrogen exchanger 3 isoform X1 [Pangasianodon hypophthalmus]